MLFVWVRIVQVWCLELGSMSMSMIDVGCLNAVITHWCLKRRSRFLGCLRTTNIPFSDPTGSKWTSSACLSTILCLAALVVASANMAGLLVWVSSEKRCLWNLIGHWKMLTVCNVWPASKRVGPFNLMKYLTMFWVSVSFFWTASTLAGWVPCF